MNVDAGIDTVVTQRAENQRPDGQIRHIVIVHYIEVNGVRSRRQHVGYLIAKAGKVGS
jgi:hypothetical protein